MDQRDDEEQPPELPPTYGELEAEAVSQGGETNARWARWRGWIEKRCVRGQCPKD